MRENMYNDAKYVFFFYDGEYISSIQKIKHVYEDFLMLRRLVLSQVFPGSTISWLEIELFVYL